LFSETLDQSIFTQEELIAIEWASNFFSNMSKHMLPEKEAVAANEQALVLRNLLKRFEK
jgi:hypothetical protein